MFFLKHILILLITLILIPDMNSFRSQLKFLLVQGRAIPQIGEHIQYFPSNWKEEFPLIRPLGLSGIEWIYDKKSEEYNPILSKSGRNEIINYSKKFNVELENVVLDWFLDNPLLLENQVLFEKNSSTLIKLIKCCSLCGFQRIIFPLLEKNSIHEDYLFDKFVLFFKNEILELLDSFNIEIHFETSLSPQREMELLKLLDHSKLKICYDMGNSTSLRFEADFTLTTISKYLGSVHVKDRRVNGPSVPLGNGNVNFNEVFQTLIHINFNGPISFQVYRNKNSNNIEILKQGVSFINNVIDGILEKK